ncbi:DUF2017 family protein [Kineosporia sp. R_H_3]|uniref:DUF2017 family protein n=1 Tax=Kineosporia sp. R_H_3 TaxID=1961848 RepID=UPI000B4B3C97|nr:DUF2017 family protein [Kineosporia sp. R_H_3]
MGGPFRRTGDRVLVMLAAPERAVLAQLLADVRTMLAAEGADDDPAADGDPASGPAPARERDPLADLVGVDDDWLAAVTAGAGLEEEPLDERPAAERFEDPAVARLLPDANREDPKVSAEFRRLTEAGLRSRKRATLDRAGAALRRPDPVVLDAEEAQALLKGLTDVRLVLAERLGLRTDQDAEMIHAVLSGMSDSEEPWVVMAGLYDELTWWQESLVRELPR